MAKLHGNPLYMRRHINGCEIVLGFFFGAGLGFFFAFLAGTICLVFANGLDLEFVILHGICHMWAFTFHFA